MLQTSSTKSYTTSQPGSCHAIVHGVMSSTLRTTAAQVCRLINLGRLRRLAEVCTIGVGAMNLEAFELWLFRVGGLPSLGALN